MKFTTLFGTCLIAIHLIPNHAVAQDFGEIIVTGSRISSFDNAPTPVVHIKRRPDYMVISTYVESDSRSAGERVKELNQSLRSLSKRAASTPHIELGLIRTLETEDDDIEYIVPFAINSIEVGSGNRPDTSRVGLVVKSPVLEEDISAEVIYQRIEQFIESIPVSGRAIVSNYGEMNFSLLNIEQYRAPLLSQLAKDNAVLKNAFGVEATVHISGLESPVRWRVLGPMQLAIFFPYTTSLQID